METYVVVIIIILIIAVLFFGFTVLGGSSNTATGKVTSAYPQAQYGGGACGR